MRQQGTEEAQSIRTERQAEASSEAASQNTFGTIIAGQSVAVRKNSTGAEVTQPRLNLVEGANISITLADDPVNSEADIVFDVSGVLPAANGGVSQAAWAAWTPTWTNVTVGTGAIVVARYIQIGKTVFARLTLVFGVTPSFSGLATFSLPVNSITYPTVGVLQIGHGTGKVSGGALYPLFPTWQSTTTAGLRALDQATATIVATAAAVPFTPAVNDEISIEFFYEAA